MKNFSLIIFLLFTLNIFSQKEANIWYFGENAGIDFNESPPRFLLNGQINTLEGCSSFSDSNGNLLFYSDGIKVFDRNHNLMTYTNGNRADDLKGDPSSTQSGMIIPKPGSSTIYYLFTVDDGPSFNNNGGITEDGKGLNYYTIDMSLNNGNGQLIDENNDGVFFTDLSNGLHNDWTEKVAAVRGKECNTFWVVSADNTNFYSFKIDDSGVNLTPVPSPVNNFVSGRGYLKLSPDGSKLAIANQSSNAVLYDFDNSNGKVSPNNGTILLNGINGSFNGGQPYGIEFSADSKKLYVSTVSGFRQTLSNAPVNYKLFQFDLTDADIPGSGTIIHEQLAGSTDFPQGGFRGALQLGPDGKIYATIPLAYQDPNNAANPNGDAPYLDVIENPYEVASKVIFTKNAIYLGTKFATQGLPPFISSLLLPINLTDSDTNLPIVSNQALQLCVNQNKTIKPDDLDVGTSNENYIWTYTDGVNITEISNSATIKNLELTNITASEAGTYSLKITAIDGCNNPVEFNATFKIEVYEQASAKKPDDIVFCDTDRDGFNSFDLNTLKDTEILDGLDSNTFEVKYFDTMDKANANTVGTEILNPYTNPTAFSSQNIYARVQNKLAPNACFAVTDFVLSVTDLPVPKQPTPYRICDNDDDGNDINGEVQTFLLNTKDTETLDGLDPTQYNITYHTTQIGAENNDPTTVIPKNANHSVTISQIVFIRVENKDNVNCYDASTNLELIVDPLPVLKSNPELDQCIAANNNNPTVNLKNAEFNISETPNATFTYFVDASGTNLITDPTSYPVQVNTTQSVFVRVTTNQNCSRDLIELKINVGQTPDNPYNALQPPVCDDFLDANGNDTTGMNNDTDNITNFSLDKANIEANINPPANTRVLYFENIQDRANTLNEIDITNYRNDINKINITQINGGVQFPIYYKILSTVNNNCQGLGEFILQINSVPKVSSETLSPISECDTGAIDGNFSNGSNRNIDLTQRIDELLAGTNQNRNDFNFYFFKSEATAISGDTSNADYIDTPTQFTNDVPPTFTQGDTVTQEIFVRVENKTTSCVNPHTSFNVIINPLPIITTAIPSLEVCDVGTKDGDVRNGLAQNIDVSQRDADILGARNAADFTITYHKTQADLMDLNSTGIDKISYDSDDTRVTIDATTNISEEVLFIRILDKNTGCVFDQSTLTIVVNPEPTFIPPTNLPYCDNNDDGDDTNQVIQDIDFDSKITEILGSTQNSNDFNVTFHKTKADASSGDSPILSPYENTNPTERIYVRIQNKKTLCVNDDAEFDLIIHPLPSFTVTTPQILCLNDLPLNISVENPNDVYSYVWTDENGTPLNTTSTDNIDISTPGNYKVTATTRDGSMCSREETIEVRPSNIATLNSSFITIVDESNIINNERNLSISIDTINNDLGPGDYQFAILNTDDNTRTPFAGFQDEPLFENLEGGIYQIIVNDKNGCLPDTTLLVSVIQFPKFFTPNGDNENETWVIKGANKTFYPDSSINIFNRFGKLVGQVPIDGQGWNGTFKGKVLPSDDYWYNITLVPADNTKPVINKKGHFSLLRR
ncbi:T9SS type B sorting domain-containing protein [Polaribacter porphyrae]|uniref:PKD domain-containing protein n=1 Tax=Polaribacter porphyrae TaxID=1137780 RepID=A0A2S7WK20_9FLAO|nr:T9SS type B sorting domain-containing protein [Polaribacter porphyrae]PQJ77949.1 hypothetical protein BTO18_01555 [Polaribacter porphyrae]